MKREELLQTLKEMEAELSNIENDYFVITHKDHLDQDDIKYMEDLVLKKGEITRLLNPIKKQLFICAFWSFYSEYANGLNMIDMYYEADDCDEWVYAVFNNGRKRFSVNYSSFDAMLRDFTNFIFNFSDYPWED